MKNEILDDLSNLRWNKHYRIWEPFMRKYNCQRICEVGVRTGRNFEKMIRHGPKLAVAVDLWRNTGDMSVNDKDYSQEALDTQYESFRDRMADKPFVKICRDYSVLASFEFEDNFFDLIYIDADHTYKGAREDLEAWYPKVKSGGLLLGDDFVNRKTRTGVRFGVMDAVNKFTRDKSISYFVFPKHKWGLIKP